MSHPLYESGSAHVTRQVYITDRDNVKREPIDDSLLSVQPDWDIDRTGSKSQVTISTHQKVLSAGDWIAPEISIIPESGDIIQQQMGHFRLGKPGINYSESLSFDNDPMVTQTATGFDIVEDIAAVRLSEPFYTPVGGHVMQDVRVLIKMATSGMLGTNLVTNGGFEADFTDWTTSWNDGGGGTTVAATGNPPHTLWSVPEGAKLGQMTFSPGAAAGSFRSFDRDITIPPGAKHVYLSALVNAEGPSVLADAIIEWRNSGGVVSGSVSTLERITTTDLVWYRLFTVAAVHPNATTARIYLRATRTNAPGTTTWVKWDDVKAGSAQIMPLPDSRINLPQITSVASTRIQTAVNKSIGYHAINEDRLKSIRQYALHTDLTGALTTRTMQSLDDAEPDRVYTTGDYRIISSPTIAPSNANVPNHFTAIKEDYENPANSLKAETYNQNPSDPFSVISTGRVVSADIIQAPDAVDQAALQALVVAARDRASSQEEMSIDILPDPTLRVFDVILFDSQTQPEIAGKWTVESIRPGMSSDDIVVRLGCRRTFGKGVIE